jgi:3-phytase
MKRVPAAVAAACLLLSACAGAPVVEREPDEQEIDPLLSQARVAHVVVPEAFITAATPEENIDSPASWRAADGQRWLIATAKDTHRLVVYDGSDGTRLRTVGGSGDGPGRLLRPNGVAVVDDLLLVVERDNRRVQVFGLPSFAPLATFGDGELQQPYGLWVRPAEGGYEVIVSDNYMSTHDGDVPPPLAELDARFKRYKVARDGDALRATFAGSFGDTTPAGAVRIAESVFGDAENGRLLLAEEDVDSGTRLREYDVDGRYRGRDIGAGLFQAQAEGMALATCDGGRGYWIATDQFKDRSVFHVFDRQDLRHLGTFAGEKTANTDGVWLDQSTDAHFPEGVFYAVDDDQAVAAFDWRDIARALRLPACREEARR